MAGAGETVLEVLKESSSEKKGNYILVVEGAIPTAKGGSYGTLGERNNKPVSMLSRLESLAANASAVIALGTCAAFGGIPAASPNPTQCIGVAEALNSRNIAVPVINIPGCPPHPDWFMGTVASILLSGLPHPEDLDEYSRPKAFYGQTIHENCPRRAYYDEGKFAKKLGDPGCLYELGCKGPVTYADCPLRLWNNGVNWCIGNGSPCLGCTEPGFPDIVSPFYEKMATAASPGVEV
jgi:hydrogenase small subunit